jgi:hypothetical protein
MRLDKIAGGKMVKSLAPFVYWAQTESEVLMRVDLKNVEEPTITLGNITATYLQAGLRMDPYSFGSGSSILG